ncbi:MAG: DUF1800 family protein [Alphaproteobacteria bacterium]
MATQPQHQDQPTAVSISDADAARFLLQAQFSANPQAIASVKALGYTGWLEREFDRPRAQSAVAWLDERKYNVFTKEREAFKNQVFAPRFGDHMIWNQLLSAPDEMRQRLAFALSQYFVVSLTAIDGFWPPYVMAAWWDVLADGVFGDFRELLERVTLSAAMGKYLNTHGNLKEDPSTGRMPDENYAREIMQLFTIGLVELNRDGTPKKDEHGALIETYTQDDVTNLARVFTGYALDETRTTKTRVDWLPYPVPDQTFAKDPMRLDPNKHSSLAVDFLGMHIPEGTPGQEALRIALDHLTNHPNVGPFFGKQMIQRLVTSDPSPAYVARVAAAFNDNGAGRRGDLKAVWRAILMDPEARKRPDPQGATSGKLREPVVRWVQWARTVGVESETGAWEIYDLSRSDYALGQSPLRSPTVFNFFRPDFSPPHTAMAKSKAPAPEFQLHDEASTAGYINFIQRTTRSGYKDVKPTYHALVPIAHDAAAVVDWLDLHMTARQLSPQTRAIITRALEKQAVRPGSSLSAKRDLLASACLLVMSSVDYLIQK